MIAGLALALAGCGPYHPEIDSRELMRPEPYPTTADLRAREPYDAAPYF